jgi:hypothetical protein
MYPEDIRRMAHILVFHAILCCDSILAIILDPKLEFATEKEYSFWLSEQAALQTGFYGFDLERNSHRASMNEACLLSPNPSDIVSKDLLKVLRDMSNNDHPQFRGSANSYEALARNACSHLLSRDTHVLEWRQFSWLLWCSSRFCDSPEIQTQLISLVAEQFRLLLSRNECVTEHTARETLNEASYRATLAKDILIMMRDMVSWFSKTIVTLDAQHLKPKTKQDILGSCQAYLVLRNR